MKGLANRQNKTHVLKRKGLLKTTPSRNHPLTQRHNTRRNIRGKKGGHT